MGHNMTSDFGLWLKGCRRKCQDVCWFAFAESVVSFLTRKLCFRLVLLKRTFWRQMESSVLSPSNWPFVLLSTKKPFLSQRIVISNIPLAKNKVNRRYSPLLGPAFAIIAFKPSIKKALLNLDFFGIIKWQIVAAHDESKIFELGACPKVPKHVSS